MQISFNPQIINVIPVRKVGKINYSPVINKNHSGFDTISFGRNPMLLGDKEAQKYVDKYKTSTSGYRGEYGKDFNDRFVYTMTQAASKYMIDHKNTQKPKTIVGGDTREATKKYGTTIASEMRNNGIDVMYPQLEGTKGDEISPIASPILALATKLNSIPLSVLLTASHNPWKDGGYNFLTIEGMVAEPAQSDEIAQNITDISKKGENPVKAARKGKKITFNPYTIYKDYIDKKGLIDFENIRKAGIDIYYEDFGGTGRYYYPRLMSEHGIELKGVLSTKTKGPNPTEENLQELAKTVKQSKNPLRIGLATDGDSDRFGAVDENGNFINANDVLTLIAYHLIKNKGMTEGTIVKNHSTSDKLDALADYFNKLGCKIEVKPTPVGFKYLGGEMMRLKGTPKEIILAGESSGGLTVRGHIPEKDGFVAISNLADLVASERKPIGEILKEVNSLIEDNFVTQDINIEFPTEEEKLKAVNSFAPYSRGEKDNIFGYEIDKEKTISHNNNIKLYKPNGDGYKIYLKNHSSILIRKSGTEPIMRYFIDSSDEEVLNNLSKNLINFAVGSNGTII